LWVVVATIQPSSKIIIWVFGMLVVARCRTMNWRDSVSRLSVGDFVIFILLEVYLLKPGTPYSSGGTPEARNPFLSVCLSLSYRCFTSGTWEDLGLATARP
jgi:hypothetical protein